MKNYNIPKAKAVLLKLSYLPSVKSLSSSERKAINVNYIYSTHG